MTLFPVAQRELLMAARRRTLFRVRTGAAMLAVAIGFFGLLVSQGDAGGTGIFTLLVVVAAVAIGVAGLLLTVDSVAVERRDGTLGLLFLTELSGFDVVAGKLAAAALGAGSALLAALPVMAIVVLLGGVTGGEVLRTGLALVNLLWVTAATGMFASAGHRESGRALLHGVILLLVLLVPLPALAELARRVTMLGSLEWIGALSPVEAFLRAGDAMHRTEPASYWRALGEAHLVGWVLVAVTAGRLPRLGDEAQPIRNSPAAAGARTAHSLSRSNFKPVPNAVNPVAFYCRPNTRERWLLQVTVPTSILLLAATVVGEARHDYLLWAPQLGFVAMLPAFWLIRGLYAWRLCEFFHGLRSGTGELLLTTPLNESNLLWGAFEGSRRFMKLPLRILGWALVAASMVAGYREDHLFGMLAFLAFAALEFAGLWMDLHALGWLAVRFGLRARSPVTALGQCLGVLGLTRLVFFLPTVITSVLLLVWAQARVRPERFIYRAREVSYGLREAVSR